MLNDMCLVWTRHRDSDHTVVSALVPVCGVPGSASAMASPVWPGPALRAGTYLERGPRRMGPVTALEGDCRAQMAGCDRSRGPRWSGLTGCTSEAPQSTTMQSNNFTFGNSTRRLPDDRGADGGDVRTDVFRLQRQLLRHRGQPWNGVTGCQVANGTSGTAANCEINVQAGRHNSAGPAQFFAQNVSAALCSWECGGSMPSNLNFAITGTITIGGTSYPITLGQGSPQAARRTGGGAVRDGRCASRRAANCALRTGRGPSPAGTR